MSEVDERIIEQLEGIKRLMILLLVKLGSDSNEIGMALDMSASSVRKIISMRQVGSAEFRQSGD